MLGALAIGSLLICVLPLAVCGQSAQTPLGISTTSASFAPRGLKRASQQSQPNWQQQQQQQQAAPFYSIKDGKTSTRRIQQQQAAGAAGGAQLSPPANNQRLRNEASASDGQLNSMTMAINADEFQQPINGMRQQQQPQQPVDSMENLQPQTPASVRPAEQRTSTGQTQRNMIFSTSGRRQQPVDESDSAQSTTPASQQQDQEQQPRLASAMMIDSFNQLIDSSGASKLFDVDFTTPQSSQAASGAEQGASEPASGPGDNKQTQSSSVTTGRDDSPPATSTRPAVDEDDESKPTPSSQPQQQRQVSGSTEPSNLISATADENQQSQDQRQANRQQSATKTRQQPSVVAVGALKSVGESVGGQPPSSLSMSLDGMIKNSRPRANSNTPANGRSGQQRQQVAAKQVGGSKSKSATVKVTSNKPTVVAQVSAQRNTDQLVSSDAFASSGDKPAAKNSRRVPVTAVHLSSPASKGQRVKPTASNQQVGDTQQGADATRENQQPSLSAMFAAGEQQQQQPEGEQPTSVAGQGASQSTRANQMTTSRLPNGDMLMSVISSDDGRERKLVMISRTTLDSLQRMANDQQQQQQMMSAFVEEDSRPSSSSSSSSSSGMMDTPTVAPPRGSRVQQPTQGVKQQQTTTSSPVSFSTSIASLTASSPATSGSIDDASDTPTSSTTTASGNENSDAQTNGTSTTSATETTTGSGTEIGARGETATGGETFREVSVQRPASPSPLSASTGGRANTATKQNSSQVAAAAAATTKGSAGRPKSDATSRQQSLVAGKQITAQVSQSGGENQRSSSGQSATLSTSGSGGVRSASDSGKIGTTGRQPTAAASGKQVVALKQKKSQQQQAATSGQQRSSTNSGKSQGASQKRNKSTATKSSSSSNSQQQQQQERLQLKQGRPSKATTQRQQVQSTPAPSGSGQSQTANNQQQQQDVIATTTTRAPAPITTTSSSPQQDVADERQMIANRTIVQSENRTKGKTTTRAKSSIAVSVPSTVSPRLELDRQLDELERANSGDDDSMSSSSGSSSSELMRSNSGAPGSEPSRMSTSRGNDDVVMNELDNLKASIPGEPLNDYPIYAEPPRRNSSSSSFSCQAQSCPSGYYADVSSRCQVFHVCRSDGQMDTFLCPNGTIFSQQHFVCVWWWQVDCAQSRDFYKLNDGIYCNSMTLPAVGGPTTAGGADAESSRGGFAATTAERASDGSAQPDGNSQQSRDSGAQVAAGRMDETNVGRPLTSEQPLAGASQAASGNQTRGTIDAANDQSNENDMNRQQQEQLEMLSRRA